MAAAATAAGSDLADAVLIVEVGTHWERHMKLEDISNCQHIMICLQKELYLHHHDDQPYHPAGSLRRYIPRSRTATVAFTIFTAASSSSFGARTSCII